MSSENPITLDDNDDTAVAAPPPPVCVDETNTATMETFLEIMPHLTQQYASQLLKKTNQNLQQALILALEETHQEQRKVAALQNQPNDDSSKMKNTAVSSLKTAPDEQDNHDTTTFASLGKEWHSLYQAALASGTVFVDSIFPPTSASLDGRRHSQTTTPTETVRCPCGLIAKSRTVQRNGPNYGRFYLSCGRQDQGKKCSFFQWDRDGSRGETTSRYSNLSWLSFQPPTCTLWGKGIGSHHVRQGAVGNCWFLSALAVIAERPHLVRQVIPHTQLNGVGIYQVNLCLDGRWMPIIIDSHLPIVRRGKKKRPTDFRGIVGNHDFVPAFCDVPSGQLWPALIEKAYAKAHGSYAQLSGGFIAEALQDLTGAPTETLVFQQDTNDMEWQELLWARLLSFQESKFLMGVATSQGGDGLVGGHAYSVLDVLEFQNVRVGEQQRMTDFFRGGGPVKKKQRTTVRLLRIRNPWGKREWKGEWSVNSEKWTTALRNKLGKQSFAKGDGTFFMAFGDVLRSFHHMDVAKCHQGWKYASIDGMFSCEATDPLVSSQQVYCFNVSERTWAYISVMQPKKRANTKTQYWYSDLSMVILRRPRGTDEDWSCQDCIVQGCSRCCSCEILLDPCDEYVCVPFSHGAHTRGSLQDNPFRVTFYSSSTVYASPETRNAESHILLKMLHQKLLGMNRKIDYPVAQNCVLLCIHGKDCLYFMVVNGASDRYLSLRLLVDTRKGMKLVYGCSGDTFDVSPQSQKIIMVALSDGTDSAAPSVSFSYVCDTIATDSSKHPPITATAAGKGECKLGSGLEITMAGDLIVAEVASSSVLNKGGDTIEAYHWLSQLGCSA